MSHAEAVKPQRSALPFLFIAALVLWVVIALVINAARTIDKEALYFAFFISLLIFAVLIAAFSQYFNFVSTYKYLIVLLICFGITISLGYALQTKQQSDNFLASDIREATIELTDDLRLGDYYWEGSAKAVLSSGLEIPVSIRIDSNILGEIKLRYGDRAQVSFTLTSPNFETSSYQWQKGNCAVLRVRKIDKLPLTGPMAILLAVRNNAIDGFDSQIAQDESNIDIVSFLAAISCGYRSDLLDTSFYNNVKKCGLAHIVAVSGAHLVIVVALVTVVLKALHIRRPIIVATSAATMLAYLVLSGCPISAIRATIMSLVCLTAYVGKRRPSTLNALGICGLVLIASDPINALSTSFLLSFASTVGIVLFCSYVTYAIRLLANVMPNNVVEPLAMTVSSNFVCLPISISLFSQLPLITLVANVVCGLAFPCVCLFSLTVGLLYSLAPPLAALLFIPLEWAGGFFALVVNTLAAVPYACIPVALDQNLALVFIFLSSALFWFFWPTLTKQKAALIIASVCMLLFLYVYVTPLFIGTRIVMLDVGQGDAILLQSGCNNLLIDTGNHNTLLREALARNGVRRLDAVLITHADDDHIGSLESLTSYITIDCVLVAKDTLTSQDEACKSLVSLINKQIGDLQCLAVGDVITFGDFTLKVLWPKTFQDNSGNIDSVCCTVNADIDHDGATDCFALFTGDAEIEQLETITEQYEIQDIDILKVAHHGSNTGLNEELAQEWSAAIALISVGENNRYGHPTDEVLRYLAQSKSKTFRTDLEGDVSCKISANEITVSTQR